MNELEISEIVSFRVYDSPARMMRPVATLGARSLRITSGVK